MNTTLLIMAAGIGSRFGADIKQLEPVGLHGEIIMDYSIHDAIASGFNKIVIVIREDIEKDFRERIGNRIEKMCAKNSVEIAYVFQRIDDIPGVVPEGRKKPWGTGHAVLTAKGVVHEPFMAINADDYYGKEAFLKMHEWLCEKHKDNAYAMAGFILKNTLSENGGVTRGICEIDEGHNHIADIVETSEIRRTENGVSADGVEIDPESFVSMNMWGLPIAFMDVLEAGFAEFFENAVSDNPLKAEYLLPTIIGGMLRKRECTVRVIGTTDQWFGVTYKEDKEAVIENFKRLIDEGVYGEELYADL